MRLINVNTKEIEEFLEGDDLPPYAILSHTWGRQEVTFKEWTKLRTRPAVKGKAGFQKIMAACRQARADHLEWFWCDTNCIDKRSSTELSEAISSMFAWYRDSEVCYAYLADVPSPATKTKPPTISRGSTSKERNSSQKAGAGPRIGEDTLSSMARSRWFTRGWTLQELLAPSNVVFFAQDWTQLCDRNSISAFLAEVTNIHIGALEDRFTIWDYSIAQRMSWAAFRRTTRSEDIAYCLFGIFDIDVPLTYGKRPRALRSEGLGAKALPSKAFRKLQEAIVKDSDDQSIFAWERLPGTPTWTGVFAPSPINFRNCGSLIRDEKSIKPVGYSCDNVGVSLQLPYLETHDMNIKLVGLNCSYRLQGREALKREGQNEARINRDFRVWIIVQRIENDTYKRGHFPISQILLDSSYPEPRAAPLRDLKIVSANPEDEDEKVDDVLDPGVTRDITMESTGLLVVIGWGERMIEAPVYTKSHSPQPFTFTPLKSRRSSGVSHALISNGVYAILLSVVWDKNNQPLHWFQSTIRDSKVDNLRQWLTQKEQWGYFFGDSYALEDGGGKGEGVIDVAHRRVRERYGHVGDPQRGELPPTVSQSDQKLQNMNGRPQVLITVVFRDSPR